MTKQERERVNKINAENNIAPFCVDFVKTTEYKDIKFLLDLVERQEEAIEGMRDENSNLEAQIKELGGVLTNF